MISKYYSCLKKGKYDERFKTAYLWKRCKDCKIELDSYVSEYGATITYHYLTKYCHLCKENRKNSRQKKAMQND